jgi:glutamate synthase (NADPH/NADH) small chain
LLQLLSQQNRRVFGVEVSPEERIWAEDKNVIVIGGGDTGSDCVGTAIRQKAKSVKQIEILPQPPENRGMSNPWPYWPQTFKNSSSHEEGCERYWSLEARRITGENSKVAQLVLQELKWEKNNGVLSKKLTSKKPVVFEADLILIAMGFTQPMHEGLLNDLNLSYDARGNVLVNEYFQTSNPKVFAVGDAVNGASLIVKALASGRDASDHIHQFLME